MESSRIAFIPRSPTLNPYVLPARSSVRLVDLAVVLEEVLVVGDRGAKGLVVVPVVAGRRCARASSGTVDEARILLTCLKVRFDVSDLGLAEAALIKPVGALAQADFLRVRNGLRRGVAAPRRRHRRSKCRGALAQRNSSLKTLAARGS